MKGLKYGPVVPSVYACFRYYGANAIKRYAAEADGQTVIVVNEDSSLAFKKVIENIWSNCKRLDGIYLSSLTHKEGTAWRKAYENQSLYLSDSDIASEEEVF